MVQTVEAMIDAQGHVQLFAPIPPGKPRRAFVTILEEVPQEGLNEVALLSEPALAEDWNRPEEDAAWSYLQSDK
jgi:hypothetical protein